VYRSFKYRLWTNATQERELATMLETHRRLYNACLAERKTRYEQDGVTVSFLEQSAKHTQERATNPFYARLNRDSAQATLRRLEKSFQNFFRRLKAGNKPGYPRFKNQAQFTSFEFPAYGSGVRLQDDRLRMQHVGMIRVKLHRPVVGTIKTVSFKLELGKWYVVFLCSVDDVTIQASNKPPVGVDVGLTAFLTTSDGDKEPNPRYLKQALPALRRSRRRMARQRRGSRNRHKTRRQFAKLHQRVARLRREHHHKTALKLVRRYGLIVVENLNIQGMRKNKQLARAISDVAWGNFLLTLRSKAESAGVAFVEVDCRGTSQICSACGRVVKKELSERRHNCICGCSLDRDENAARNILARGLPARTGPAEGNVGQKAERPPRSRRPRSTAKSR
jgi:putative transposase